jgi:hypothetical protein
MDETFYRDLDFQKFDGLILGLDSIIKAINYDRSTVDQHQLRRNITKEFALERCSPEALAELESGGDREVATHDCNILRFDNYHFNKLHNAVASCVYTVLPEIKGIAVSGRTWYPPEYGFMGWHTNSNNKAYRLYCTFCREPDKSFFRYRDPKTNEIVTSWDKAGWNFRLFKITNPPLWHCVYSETDRFSIGYAVHVEKTW